MHSDRAHGAVVCSCARPVCRGLTAQAAAIQQIKTPIRGNTNGWPWIFLLEGIFTVLVGLGAFFLMPRSPAACRFLSASDKHVIEQLLLADGAGETREDKFSWSDVRAAFTSPVVLLTGICFFCSGTTLFGLAVFLPSTVSSLGYSPTRTQLLTVPRASPRSPPSLTSAQPACLAS